TSDSAPLSLHDALPISVVLIPAPGQRPPSDPRWRETGERAPCWVKYRAARRSAHGAADRGWPLSAPRAASAVAIRSASADGRSRSEEHTSELQSRENLV